MADYESHETQANVDWGRNDEDRAINVTRELIQLLEQNRTFGIHNVCGQPNLII